MAVEEHIRETRVVQGEVAGDVASRETETISTDDSSVSANTTARRIIYFVASIINGLLGIRMLLSLFAANRANAFADFIYTVTSPFVAPFRSLFGIDTRIGDGGSRFEVETLVAIVVVSLIAWVLAQALLIGTRNREQ